MRRLDILVAGMDKITDKSAYYYDAFGRRGISVLIYSRDKTGFYARIRDRIATPVVLVPSGVVRDILKFCWLLIRLRPRQVELYQTHIISQLTYVLLLSILRIPFSAVCIGELYTWDRHRRIRQLVNTFTYRRAGLLVLTEQYMRRTLEEKMIASVEKTVFCHNRIPIPPPETCSSGTPEATVLFLNSFKPWRRLEILIEAAPLVLEQVPSAQFLLVGHTLGTAYMESTHGYTEGLMARVRELGLEEAVRFEPFTEDPEAYYRQAAVFALPADLIFCNFSLLEAMARCVPAVVSRTDGSELIIDDGEDGFIREQDPEAFAAALIELLTDEPRRERMGRAARSKIIERYSIHDTPDILLEGYAGHLGVRHGTSGGAAVARE